MFLTCCTSNKRAENQKIVESPRYKSLKNDLEKNIVGLWRLNTVVFRESGMVNPSKRKELSKIKLIDTIYIDFKLNHRFEINSKEVGKWKFQELNVKLSGEDVELPVPFFCNSEYLIGIQKTYSKLTTKVSVGGNFYDVQYILVR